MASRACCPGPSGFSLLLMRISLVPGGTSSPSSLYRLSATRASRPRAAINAAAWASLPGARRVIKPRRDSDMASVLLVTVKTALRPGDQPGKCAAILTCHQNVTKRILADIWRQAVWREEVTGPVRTIFHPDLES